MRKKKLIIVPVILFFLCIFSTPSYSLSIPDLDYITEEYPPENYKKDGEVKGIFVDTLLLILKKLDKNKSAKGIKLLPWARGYYYLQTKDNIVLFATSRTKKREKLFKWVGPVSYPQYVLLAPKYKKIKIQYFDDLLKYNIGVVREDVAEQILVEKGYPEGLLKPVPKPLTNAKKLEYGRIDMWAYGSNSARWVLKENGFNPDNYKTVYNLSEKKPLYFAFSKAVPAKIIKAFQDELDRLKEEGRIKKIIDSYIR